MIFINKNHDLNQIFNTQFIVQNATWIFQIQVLTNFLFSIYYLPVYKYIQPINIFYATTPFRYSELSLLITFYEYVHIYMLDILRT